MDHISHFRREVRAFEAAARRSLTAPEAPVVPSCPQWTMSDPVAHLGRVHRVVTRVVVGGLTEPPPVTDIEIYALPEDRTGWPATGGPTPTPGRGDDPGPARAGAGAARIRKHLRFRQTDGPGEWAVRLTDDEVRFGPAGGALMSNWRARHRTWHSSCGAASRRTGSSSPATATPPTATSPRYRRCGAEPPRNRRQFVGGAVSVEASETLGNGRG